MLETTHPKKKEETGYLNPCPITQISSLPGKKEKVRDFNQVLGASSNTVPVQNLRLEPLSSVSEPYNICPTAGRTAMPLTVSPNHTTLGHGDSRLLLEPVETALQRRSHFSVSLRRGERGAAVPRSPSANAKTVSILTPPSFDWNGRARLFGKLSSRFSIR